MNDESKDPATAKQALLDAFDRLFDHAAQKLKVECSQEERDEAKNQFVERFSALLEALEQVRVDNLPEEVLSSIEHSIDEVEPSEVVGMLASIPLAQRGRDILRTVAYRAAEKRLLDHLISQADDRYGGN